MAYIQPRIDCDGCSTACFVSACPPEDENPMRRDAAEEGWSVKEGFDFCPDCTKKQRQPDEDDAGPQHPDRVRETRLHDEGKPHRASWCSRCDVDDAGVP